MRMAVRGDGVGGARHRRRRLLVGTALTALLWTLDAPLAFAEPAPGARPQGGKVTAGQADIRATTTTTQITQSSPRAVIDWTSFDVGRAQSVIFSQPNAGATVLNRVNAAEPSQIAGRISANGRVIIENRSGVVFTESAQIDANALVVSAAGIANDKFMAGGTHFDQPARDGAAIINRGRITVRDTGLVALVAPRVSNEGVIVAKAGRVVLAGAATHVVDLYGDGLLSIETAAPASGVRNSGSIVAEGGRVLLTAGQADAMVTNLVEAGGRISAAGTTPGSVRIQSTGGSVIINGEISAASRAPTSVGGKIEIAATGTVTLAATARVTAAGPGGGGTIAIGRANGITAARTDIRAGATVSADATRIGRGGSVTVMSTQSTAMAGRITATGGKGGGAGGEVEVSGKRDFALTGSVDVSAPAGPAGTLLIDPQDLIILTGGSDNALFQQSGGGGSLTVGNNGGAATAISASIDPAVFANLAGNVVLQAARDLIVQSPVTAAATNLTLQAGRNLTVNAPLALVGGGTIALAAAVAAFAGQPGYDAGGPNGILAIAPAGGVSAPAGQIRLSSGAGGILSSGPLSGASLDIAITGGGAFILGGTVQAGAITIAAGQIAMPGTLRGTTVQLTTQGGGAIDIAGTTVAAGSLAITAGTAILANGSIAAQNLTLSAGGALAGAGGTLVADTLILSAGGDVTLTGANRIAAIGGAIAVGSITINDQRALRVAQPIAATGAGRRLSLVSSDAITIAAGASLTADGAILLTAQSAGAGSIVIGAPVTSATGSVILAAGVGGVDIAAPVSAGPGATLAIVGDRLANPGANPLSALGGTIAIAPFTVGAAMTLGVGGNLAPASTAGLTASTLLIGAAPATPGAAPATRAGSILVSGFDATGITTLALAASGAITQSGPLTNVARLDATGGSVTLIAAANSVAALGAVTSTGDFRLVDGVGLTILGTIQAGTGGAPNPANTATIQLDIAGPVTIGQPGTAALLSAGTVTLTSPAAVAEVNGGIRANFLQGPQFGAAYEAATSVSLRGANTITTLGGFTTAGDFAFANSIGLNIAGGLIAGTPAPDPANTTTIDLLVRGSLAIGAAGGFGAISAGRVNLMASGAITEPHGIIATNLLQGPATGQPITATVSVSLTGTNRIAAIGGFTSAGNIHIITAQDLVLTGNILAGSAASVILETTGDLRIGNASSNALLNAGTVALLASGGITEVNGGVVANLLTGPAPGAAIALAAAADLRGTNVVNQLGAFTTAGNFSFSDSAALTIVGAIAAGPTIGQLSANTARIAIVAVGNLAIGQGGTAAVLTAGTISLVASGAITENQNSSVNARLLTGTGFGEVFQAAADVSLAGANTVGTLGSFASSGHFLFRNKGDLTVTGVLSAGALAAPDPVNTASLALVVDGNLVLGAANAPVLLNAGTIGLAVTGTISEPAGTIRTNLINDPSLPGIQATARQIRLDGSNTIAAIGEIGARNDFFLANTTAIAILGTVSAGGVVAPALANTGTLTLAIDGGIAIGNANLAGGLNAGTVALRTVAAISQPNGAITANLLDLSAPGAVPTSLATVDLQGANAITRLAALTATGDVRINTTTSLTLEGAATIGVPGPGNPASLALGAGGNLVIAAPINAGTVVLAAAGTISQPGGAITADLLLGPGAGQFRASAAAVDLRGANRVGELGGFTAAGPLQLADDMPLTLSGTIAAGSLSLTVNGAIAIGTILRPVALAAGTVTLLTGPGPAAAIASAAVVTLTGTNTIGGLGDLVARGDITVANTSGLTVLGTVSAGGALAPDAANQGRLAIGLTGGALRLGSPSAAGWLNAGTVALAAAGGITQPNGRITANLFNDQTGIAGVGISPSVSLPGPANVITALGGLSSSGGDIDVQVAGTVSIAGPINAAHSAIVTASGALLVTDRVSSGTGGITLTGDLGVRLLGGLITDNSKGGNQVAINAPHGDVVQNQGAVIASPGTIRISAFGTISLGSLLNIPHGRVILASDTGSIGEIGAGSLVTLSLAASAPGSIILEASTNRITTLGDIAAGGRFALISAGSLAIAGTQVAGLDIAITGSLAVSQNSGRIAAGGSGVRIAAPGRGGLLTQDQGATIVATGNDGTIALSGANGLALGGTLSASGTAALVALVTPLGSLTQSTGAITATRLSATAALGIALDAAAAQNRVAAAETLSTTSGALSFTSLSSFALTGVAQAKTAVGLRSAGNLVLTPTARVSASDGPVGLQAGGNLSIQSGAEISGASVSASAPLNLTLGGRIAGDKIFLGAPGGGGAALVAFSDGAILQTAAAGTYGATVPIAAWPNIATAPAGAFIAAKGLSIAGTLTVVGQPGAASQTLRIDLSGQGDVDRAGGLLATTTTVFLNLGSRANLAGQFQVAGLHIAYPRSSAGSADLSGTVRGVGGQAAAQISTVTPTPNALYRINACPIASVSCFVVSTERLPQSIPVRDLEIRPARDTIDETEVLLPNVSRRDF